MRKTLRKTKQRIKFLDNFQKITKSISLLSAVKFQKINTLIKNIMINVFYCLSIFAEIQRRNPSVRKIVTNLVSAHSTNKTLIIVIASDRGLAGSFDQMIFNETDKLITNLQTKQSFIVGAIGKKADKYLKKKFSLAFSFTKIENVLARDLALELIDYLDYLIEESKIDKIIVIFSKMTTKGFFVEPLQVYPFNIYNLDNLTTKILSSATLQELKKDFVNKYRFSTSRFKYILEPNDVVLANFILKKIMFLIIYAIILESQATLEFTRTITMRRAYENSNNLKNKELIYYNKLRQQKITEELIDLAKSGSSII